MRKTAASMLLLPLLCAALPAAAAGAMKQGLWETTIKSDQMKAMPKLTPEQMEMMRQRGINIPQMSDGGMVTKMCVSKEMAERNTPPTPGSGAHGESDCKPQNVQMGAGSYTADLVCNGPNMQGTGKIKATYAGNTSFSSTYDFKGTSHGAPVSTHMETNGKWVADDCGSVKPYGVPAK